MSYGEDAPPLDLTGMHMLCLSGENGHGKSALLDAMTWALWGESRAGKNKHDELVRIGADEMSVQFTFAMDDQTFRVLRKRSKRANGNQWELQQEQEDGGWRSLTGNDSRETERAIQKLLRMSYDTFLNSAYLRQGQADLFVKQTPGRRKEILADILDLSRYDKLEDKARARSKQAAAESTDLERDISLIDAELESEAAHRDALAALQARLAELAARRDELKAAYEDARDRRRQLEEQQTFAEALRVSLAALAEEIAALEQHVAADSAEESRLTALLARQEEICRDFEALTETRAAVERLAADERKFFKGQQMLADAEREFTAAEREVRTRFERARADVEETEARLRELPDVLARRAEVAVRVAESDALAARRDEADAALHAAHAEFSALKEQSGRIQAQIDNWTTRLDELARQQGTCRVCDAPLPPTKIAAVRETYQAALDDLTAQRKDVRAEAARVKTDIVRLTDEISGAAQALKRAADDQKKLGNLDQQALELEAKGKNLPRLVAARDAASALLQSGEFAPDLRARRDDYARRLSALDGAEAAHAAARARLDVLLPAERLHIELAHAQASLADVSARVARDRRALAARQKSRADTQAQLDALANVAQHLAALQTQERDIRQAEDARRQENEQAARGAGRREQALARCDALKTDRADKSVQFAAAKTDAEGFKQLADAFGKNGVQALIIENAIPELQEETNRLLERLTDGDMTVYFETLRAAKSKKDQTIETLDIKVSDSLGTRPLEMYSGGEGFRAAFALRIALSKLLARRAGAKLQTLIIDEGFGTQDGAGREKLVDALNVIKSDFEKIIIITHIDELKDAFPTRIEITKTTSGSQITVLEGAAG